MRSILQNKEELNKALTMLVVENTLLENKNSTYEYVVGVLNKECHCGLTDTYEHPEHLRFALKKLYGNSYGDIVNSIKKQLNDFSDNKLIEKFVDELSQ